MTSLQRAPVSTLFDHRDRANLYKIVGPKCPLFRGFTVLVDKLYCDIVTFKSAHTTKKTYQMSSDPLSVAQGWGLGTRLLVCTFYGIIGWASFGRLLAALYHITDIGANRVA